MTEWKVLLYNMHHGRDMEGRSNLERIAKLVNAVRPDIVGFNEVDRFFAKRSGFEDQFGWFCGELGMHCAFGPAITRKKGVTVREYGNALFSRYPIISHRNHGFRCRGLVVSEPRAILEAEVPLGSDDPRSVKVYLTHLSIIPVIRRIQTEMVVRRLEAEESPAILLGDFNMMPGSGTWSKLSGVLVDATNRVRGAPLLTFPALQPATQKDYIFTSESIRVNAVELVTADRQVSDHLPLLAVLRI